MVAGPLARICREHRRVDQAAEDVLLSAYTAQRTSPIVIDESIVKEFRRR